MSLTYLSPAAWAESTGSLTTSGGGAFTLRACFNTFFSTRLHRRVRVAIFALVIRIAVIFQLRIPELHCKPVT
jgi:hypothetical protein